MRTRVCPPGVDCQTGFAAETQVGPCGSNNDQCPGIELFTFTNFSLMEFPTLYQFDQSISILGVLGGNLPFFQVLTEHTVSTKSG